MKKETLLLVVGFAFSFATEVCADKKTDYSAFVKEGKEWKCLQPGDGSICTYIIEGDTVIGGKDYKKTLCQDRFEYMDDARHYFAAVREESRQVFVVNAGQEQEYMLYDFSPEEDVSLIYDWWGMGVTRSKGIPFWYRDEQHHKFTVYPFIIDSDVQPIDMLVWIDGLGNLDRGPFFAGSYGKELLACYEKGRCVFEYEDQFHFNEPDYPYNQDSLMTLAEAKQWVWQFEGVVDPTAFGEQTWLEEMVLKGDTLIDGDEMMICKRMFSKRYKKGESVPEEWTQGKTVFIEKGRKLFAYDVRSQMRNLIMDFTLQVGDVFQCADGESMTVTAVSDTILENSSDKSLRQCIYLRDNFQSDCTDIWIEGIGSVTYGIIGMHWPDGIRNSALLKCCTPEETLFENKYVNTGIAQPSPSFTRQSSNATYDLQGRPLTTMPRKGVLVEKDRKQVVK